jgi:hypothetical protein
VEDFGGIGLNDFIVQEGKTTGPMFLVTEIGRKLLEFISYESEKYVPADLTPTENGT